MIGSPFTRVAIPLVLCIAFLALAGCGSGGIERCMVEGKVTVDGVPLEIGEIYFVPIEGTQGPTWAAKVRDGSYAAEGKGVPVGTLRVEIDGWKAKKVVFQDDGVGDAGESYIKEYLVPEKYTGKQSPLRLNIPSGSGKIQKDFDVRTSKR